MRTKPKRAVDALFVHASPEAKQALAVAKEARRRDQRAKFAEDLARARSAEVKR